MEELIDFLVDVFENVWRKFKINFVFILMGGIVCAALYFIYMLGIFPPHSHKSFAVIAGFALSAFLLTKVCVMTILETKINLNTVLYIFDNLLKPFIFLVFLVGAFGALVLAAAAPFVFKDFADKSYTIVASIVAGISVLTLLPNALTSLFLFFEGKSFKEAFSA